MNKNKEPISNEPKEPISFKKLITMYIEMYWEQHQNKKALRKQRKKSKEPTLFRKLIEIHWEQHQNRKAIRNQIRR